MANENEVIGHQRGNGFANKGRKFELQFVFLHNRKRFRSFLPASHAGPAETVEIGHHIM
jgi:hypothetical protein